MPKPTAARKPPPATRKVTVPAPEDLELAKNDALLQLRIGRAAHAYTVFVSAALALDGILILLFYPQLPTLGASDRYTVAVERTFYLLLPLLAGLGLAAIGVASKWEAFQLWPWEGHFATTVGALALNVLLAVLYALRIVGMGPLAHVALFPWFYPLELAAISVALLGFVLTWSGWSGRQLASALSALLPVATALIVYVPPASSRATSDALVVSLFLSAIFTQTSGSFLHLISSGTRVHERELITSGQSRMFRFADELREREEALHFREAAVVKRAADVQNSESSIGRQRDSLTEARAQLDGLEEDYRARSDGLVEKERAWAGQIAEMDARTTLLDDRTKALELREQEVKRLGPQLSAREERLVQQEGLQTQRDVELTQRGQDVERRTTALAEGEARLEERRKQVEEKTADLLRREGEVSARELAAPSGPAGSTGAAQELAAREVKLQQFKLALDEQNVVLGRRAREAADRAKVAKDALTVASQKEADLARREAALRQREGDLSDRLKIADERRTQYETAVREHEARVRQLGEHQSETAKKSADVDRTMKSLTDREAALAERERRQRATTDTLDRREHDLLSREEALRASEAEVSLRRQAIERGPSAARAAATAPTSPGRGPEAPRIAPSRPERAAAIRDMSSETAPVPDTLAAPAGRRFADRLPTGTPRLDDLLLGGIPPHGHIVLLGDAFVGKEVVLYAFVAEGLKRGEPIVLVTAARSPSEVSESLGVVLPQFREYEQMGMVRWIDASGSGGKSDGQHTVVASSDDRPGILSNLVKVANATEGSKRSPFRVGFLGLSAVLAHGDERASFSFLQNVVGILKPRSAVAMYSLEGGALSEAAVETLLSRMDGAIVFRQERDRLYLSVKGFGEVETRDSVECRATQRALVVGSFALERIR